MESRSHIFVINVIIQPDGGGAERLVRELTARLPGYGVQSVAIYFSNPRGVSLTDQEFNLSVSKIFSIMSLIRLRRMVGRFLRSDRCVIVHGHLTWPLYFLPIALVGIGVKLVYTEHNTHNRRRNYLSLRPLERWLYGLYHCIACISCGAKVSLDSWLGKGGGNDRTHVVINGSRLLPYIVRPAWDERGLRLVAVGSLSVQKGFDIALRAIALLDAQVEEFTILGEGVERSKLEALACELGIQDKVNFLGYVDDVTPYFHRADLGLVPSRWEGFGLVAVEALSTGLPLVASNVEGMREVLKDCPAARLVEPEDARALAAGINYAFNELVGRQEIANCARMHSEKFRIERMVDQYVELYSGVF